MANDFKRGLVDNDTASIADIEPSVPLAIYRLHFSSGGIAFIETVVPRFVAALARPPVGVSRCMFNLLHFETLSHGRKSGKVLTSQEAA